MAQAQPARTDPIRVDSNHYQVEFENDRVRVLRTKYGPQEKSVMHSHPASVAVFLSNAKFRFTFPDGKTEEGTINAGQAMYLDAVDHLPENTGDQSFEVLLIELKD